jgi:DNA-binding winged helix-turn-helix (wHTH) protein
LATAAVEHFTPRCARFRADAVNDPGPAEWRFLGFELDSRSGELRREGERVKIQRKPLELLIHLVRHRGRTVPKAELLENVWRDVRVSEEALASALRDVRRALGDVDRDEPIIVTEKGRGYRFEAPLAKTESTWETAFVGRRECMAQLFQAHAGSLRGELRASFVSGPSGIGKTRATGELLKHAIASGSEAHSGRCSEGAGATPFWPWLQIIRSCLAARGATELRSLLSDSHALKHLAWILPELAVAEGAEVRTDLTGSEARFRLFDAMTQFLRALAKTGPLALVLEDLHWADDASLLLLEFLAEHLGNVPLHLIGTLRPVEASHPLARVLGTSARYSFAERIELGALGRDAVTELVVAAASDQPSPAFIDAVCAATGGNAFLVTELTRTIASGKLDVTSETRSLPVPARARDAILSQIQPFSTEGRELLGLASLMGSEFDSTLLALANGVPQGRVLELLGAAEKAGLVTGVSASPGRFAFIHDLVRETIRQDLPTLERIRMHRRLGEALEPFADAGHTERLHEVAHHFAEAAPDGVADKAVQFSRRAAEHSMQSMAFEDAVAQYDRALTALRLLPEAEPRLRSELLVLQGYAAWGTMEDANRVRERFVDAARAAKSAGSAKLFARAALGRTGDGGGTGDYRDIFAVDTTDIELLGEARDVLGEAPSTLRALVLSRLALAIRYTEGFDAADVLAREAVRLGETLSDAPTLGSVLRYRHELLSSPDHTRERLQIATRLLELARRTRSRPLELDALYFVSRNHFELGDGPAAARTGAQADALARTMRHPGASFRPGIRQVLIATLFGAFEEAEKLARAFRERDAARNLNADGTLQVQLATLNSFRGRHAAAIDELTAVFGPYDLPWRSHALAREYALSGRLDAARDALERAAANHFRSIQSDHTRLGSMMDLAECCGVLADAPLAAELYALMSPYTGMLAAPLIATICLGSIDRGLGILASVLERWDEAEAHFLKAVEIDERYPALLPLTLARYGSMLVARGRAGDDHRGKEMLGRATHLADRIGMATLTPLAVSAEAPTALH